MKEKVFNQNFISIYDCFFIYLKQTMLPISNNSLNQYHPHTGYYGNQLYYVPQEAALLYHPHQEDYNNKYPFLAPFPSDYPPMFDECPVKIEQRQTKPSEVKNEENQSSVSANNLQEESQDHSPQLRFKQKYGRNINSNIFHHMVKRLLADEKLINNIKKVIAHVGTVLNLQEFMENLTRKQQKLRSYVSFYKMTKLFKGQKYRNRIYKQTLVKQAQFSKIFRIVCRYYLKNIHILHAYNILKIKGESKKLHIAGLRKILELMHPK